MHPSYQSEMSGNQELDFVPHDSQGQLSVAFRMIENAFNTAEHAHETEREELRAQIETCKLQNAKLAQNAREQEAQKLEFAQQFRSLRDDNRKLIEAHDRQNKRIKSLETFQHAILSATTQASSNDDSFMDLSAICPSSLADFRGANPTICPTPVHGVTMSETLSPALHRRVDGPVKGMDAMSPAMMSELQGKSEMSVGRAFFKQAKHRMTVEQFTSLIGAVKLLNQGLLSTETLMTRLNEYFPELEYNDLKDEFERLLASRLLKEKNLTQ